MNLPCTLRTLLLLLSVIWASGLSAQATAFDSAAAAPVTVVETGPDDALNRGTPRSSIIGYLEAAAEFDYEKAAQYLDLRNLPAGVYEVGGTELARQLNHVLTRAVWLDDYTVSDKPEGLAGDGLPSYRDQLVVIKTQAGEVPLWMQRVPRGDGEMIWKLSNRSVALIPDLYDEFSYPEQIERIRKWFPENASFLGFELFKWVIVLSLALVSWPVFYLLGRLLTVLVTPSSGPTRMLWRKVLTGPLVAVGILVVMGAAAEALGVGPMAQEWMDAHTLNTIVIVWFIWSVLNLIKTHKQGKLMEQGRPGAAKLLQPMMTFLKIIVLIFGSLFWLNNLGVNISTVLAGLGVGGLALALALQKPIEDMMGALTLFAQAPIRVGDLCKYAGYIGEIEDIGLRSTTIRTLTNTVIHVPNARIAHVELENLSERTKIRYWPTLRLRYDTPPEKLQQVLDEILEMFNQHEEVYEEPLRARFTDFDEDALLVKLHAFMKTTDFHESLRIQEDLNFRVMQIVYKAGVQFAMPGRTIYMEEEEAPVG